MDALLISYTPVDFRTKTEMELALRRLDANKEKWLKKFKAAGMVSNINNQIWKRYWSTQLETILVNET